MDLVLHIKVSKLANMNQEQLKKQLGKIDIYLLDQIMKHRYLDTDLILDAGCGKGRNIETILGLGLNIVGCDSDLSTIQTLQQKHPTIDLRVNDLSDLSYQNSIFNHIICNAVLHFANDIDQFKKMISELYRVLKPNGTLFIRMTSIFGIENTVIPNQGQYKLPDGTNRFLLTSELVLYLDELFTLIEPLKTVNVNNLRCMSTLILKKQ